MKYKDFNGPIEELILLKLREIEEAEGVKILHAVESGSRAWGFASPDSDYDVRFIYIRPLEFYLGLQAKKDFIEWELDDVLDINGWDLTKALQHFHKSNATMFEWSNSPVVYYTTPEWDRIRQETECCFSSKSALYHYYGTAKKNYLAYLQDEMVKYKKYFYVLRPILACKWIEKKQTPPLVLFEELVKEVLEEEMQPLIKDLTRKKMQMEEAQKAERIDAINEYIKQSLGYFEKKLEKMEDDRMESWDPVNALFLEMLNVHRD